jgi:inward rectifier potassium channel
MNFNRKAKQDSETGLGINSNYSGGRFFHKNGQANIIVKGSSFFERLNIFHFLLSLSRLKFVLLILSFFIGINLFFALIYLLIGVEHLGGLVFTSSLDKFGEAFFFSAQTFTTVGYGRINPIGFLASSVAAIEALTGLMSFALVTGLLYGRFSKPKAFIRFSENALFTPFKDGVALMLRMVPYTKNYLVNVEAKVTLAMRVMEDGVLKNKFYNLDLDISKANTLTSNWTLVHPINENSPLWGFTKKDIDESFVEILVFIQGFDESFSNTVVTRTSYTFEEFVYGAKFVPMYHPSPDHSTTILELDLLDNYNKVELPTKF